MFDALGEKQHERIGKVVRCFLINCLQFPADAKKPTANASEERNDFLMQQY
jgi:hypothetical protein